MVRAPGDSRLAIRGTLQVATAGGLRLERFDLDSTVAVLDPSSLAAPFGLDASWLGALQGSAELSLTDGRIEAGRLAIDAGHLGALRLKGSGDIGRLTAQVPSDLFGICVVGTSGNVHAVGDAEHDFTIAGLVAREHIGRGAR